MATRIEQLRSLYSEARQANDAYWADLRKMAERIRKDFAHYLGVSDAAYTPGPLSVPNPVLIGHVNDGGYFTPASIESLKAQGDAIQFSLKLSYGSSGPEDERYKIFDLAVRNKHEVYEASYAGESFKGPIFSELYARLVTECKESIAAVGDPRL